MSEHNERRRSLWLLGGGMLALSRPRAGAALTVAGGSAERIGDSLRAFGSYRPGPVGSEPPGWVEQRLGNVEPNRCDWVAQQGRIVLRLSSRHSASAVVHAVPESLRAARRLGWRWRVDGFPAQSRLGDKPGDDFAARVYVMFDYPLERVPFADRIGLRIARMLHGDTVPAATLVYLWHPSAARETLLASPYTSRAQMIVARSEPRTGLWFAETRDLLADFQRGFGAQYGDGIAPLAAIALGADTDQSGGELTSWFDQVSLD